MLDDATLMAFVATADPGRARAFYGGTLGLPLVEENEFAMVFQAGSVQLRVAIVERVRPHPFTVLGWRVADIEAVVDELGHHGVSMVRHNHLEQDRRGIWTAPDGDRVAWFDDTDGNILSVSQHG